MRLDLRQEFRSLQRSRARSTAPIRSQLIAHRMTRDLVQCVSCGVMVLTCVPEDGILLTVDGDDRKFVQLPGPTFADLVMHEIDRIEKLRKHQESKGNKAPIKTQA